MATPGLIGRERELAALRKAIAAAGRHRGGLVLVAGEAGIGKTALVEHALDRRRRVVLRGTGRASGTAPLGPIAAALRSHPGWPRVGEQAMIDIDDAGVTGDLVRFVFPELAGGRGEAPAPAAGPADPAISLAGRRHVDAAGSLDAIARLVVALSRIAPVAMLLDDLHRADHATLDVLPVLARLAEREPLLVVGIYRTDELARTSPVRRLRSELRRAGRLDELVVGPLDADAIVALAARVIGARPDASLGRRLVDRSQGLPLFVAELAAALVADGAITVSDGVATLVRVDLPVPESLRDSILVRADGLPTRQLAALSTAAILGDEIDVALVDELVHGAGGWVRAGLERGILVARPDGRVAFAHELVREVFLEEAPAQERRARHRRVAAALAGRRPEPIVVAEHLLSAGEPNAAVPWLLEAADASCRIHAYRDAAAGFARALDEDRGAIPSRVAVLERLADCAELSGGLGEATRAWEAAAAARDADGRPELAGEDHRRRARALEVAGRWRRAIDARADAAEAYDRAGLPAESATERLAAAAHLRSAASFSAALELVTAAGALAVTAGRRDLEARAMGLEGNIQARMGDSERGLRLVRGGLSMALDLGYVDAAAELYQRLADSLEHAGRYEPAQMAYLEGADYCRTRSIDQTAQLCLACMAVVLWQTGDWSGAEQTSREVLFSPDAAPHARAVAEGILGIVAALRGRPGRARQHLETSLQIGRHIELAAMEIIAGWGLGLCDRLEGDEPGAVERCHDLLARWERTEERHYVVPALRWAATVFADRADTAGVRACADALARIAAQTGQPEAIAALGTALGEAARLEGDPVAAAAHLATALDAVSSRNLPLERAEIGRRAGVALARVDRRAEGIAALVAAIRTARRLGATPLGAAIAADLAALGERVDHRIGRREARRLADHGLTQRELEVIRLAARGMSSREIGRDLFISPRTVEMHVGTALSKLDCRTRAEAVRRLAALGLLDGRGMTEGVGNPAPG